MYPTYAMSKNPMSLSLVLIQGLSIIYIFMTGPVIIQNPFLIIFEVIALILGVWSVSIMIYKSKIHVTPEVAVGAKLVESGPYKFIRHPMYSALLLLTLAFIINLFTWERLFFWIILFLDLMLKITYEEQILERHFHGYKEYSKKTKKLIPQIY
jgi:protein-S-isoprenylcysteine O-methyltransferase Ste14